MFHAIILVDLFEHLSRPLELLNKLSQRLTDNGLLLIATGNGDATACRRDPALFWDFRNLQRLCMLTRKHAWCLCDRPRLRLEASGKVGHYDRPVREKTVQIPQTYL